MLKHEKVRGEVSMYKIKNTVFNALIILIVLAVINVEMFISAFGHIPVIVTSVVGTFVAAAISAWNECKKEGV